jgi:hypothetical protein
MSRSAYAVAYTCLSDLHEVQDAFNDLRVMFTVMLDLFQEDSTPHAFAQLGMATVEDWSGKIAQWSECMDNELDNLSAEADAHGETWNRLGALRDATKAAGDQP